MTSTHITIKGARHHNLKNITVSIPKNSLTVITGLSGSGKTSLAFDTLYVEGQRRYMESLSSYAKQFIETLEKPDCDAIEGLSPTIAIDQKSASNNPRSTVGTMTEIYDLLRIVYARCGTPHCPRHPNQQLTQQAPPLIVQRITESLTRLGPGKRLVVATPVVRQRKGEHRYLLQQLKRRGIKAVYLDSTYITLDEAIATPINGSENHTIDAEVLALGVYTLDRETVRRIDSAVRLGLSLGEGVVYTMIDDSGEKTYYSQHYTCTACGYSLPELEPRLFSFNSPHGACEACQGLGTRLLFSEDLIVPNRRLTLAEGAVRPWSRMTSHSHWYQDIIANGTSDYGIDVNIPVYKFASETWERLMRGNSQTFEGVIPNLERRWRETDSPYVRQELEKFMVRQTCPECRGKRLRAEIQSITLANRSIVDTSELTITQCRDFISENNRDIRQPAIYQQLQKEILARLDHLANVGLGYLTLSRTASTLAGGEAQRIRLATQLGSALEGVIYVLDEPSIGLHPRDHFRLITTLKLLRDSGNTVIVIEHDAATMKHADYVIDIGPGAGKHGGVIVAEGTPAEVMTNSESLTGLYLSGEKAIEVPRTRRTGDKWLMIIGAREFNLRDLTVKIPLERLVCISGVSGSGKSTLASDVLAKSLARIYHRSKVKPAAVSSLKGTQHLDKVIEVDQSPIGRTPRSNPVTYVGIFGLIREIFADQPLAVERGYDAGHFSFNLHGGRCDTCRGDGQILIEMNFLPNTYVTCSECKGSRYKAATLEVAYKGKTIADVLAMTVDEAIEYFDNHELIGHKLRVLSDVGLGYLPLGQAATTLSGGEAQRIKLATELARQSSGKTLYILDEPTTGLHFEDVRRLLAVLHALVDKGNSVVVVEHDLDVIKNADWVIDMGPDGGDMGGMVVAEGTPEAICLVEQSATGRFLKEML